MVELRGLFTAYLEQLQTQEGPEMEALMVQALEAADLLDGAIALHKVRGERAWEQPAMPFPPRALPAGSKQGGPQRSGALCQLSIALRTKRPPSSCADTTGSGWGGAAWRLPA